MKFTEDYLNVDFDLNNIGLSNAIDSAKLPRHRWYYFKEGFSPHLVKTAIRTYNLGHNNIVLDPFNGSGTVTLSASESNISSVGLEVNPFTSFVAKAKILNTKNSKLSELYEKALSKIEEGKKYHDIESYSTFSEAPGKNKWLFNLNVLRAFYGGFKSLEEYNNNAAKLLKLALLSSIMENSNARKDGKCLKYKTQWQAINYNKESFLNSFKEKYNEIKNDIIETKLNDNQKPELFCTDSRNLMSKVNKNFDLVVTSPPYLNTFDYTDIYRPELFIGRFVKNPKELYQLRLKTVRSHIQANWKKPDIDRINSSILNHYYQSLCLNLNLLMDKKIPLMVLAYFEDMSKVFGQLHKKANKNAHIWMVVSNSAYANMEIPVDLILADIATKYGWKLKEIGVLREISKRKTKYSPDISKLRESVIILEKKHS